MTGCTLPSMRRGLVVPGHAPGGGVERDDGGREQAVEPCRPELAQIIGRGIGRAEVDQVQGRVVGKAVPGGSAAVEFGFAMRIPAFIRERQFGIFVRLPDRRRHRVEAPLERAGFHIVGRDIAAHGAMSHVGAPIADDDRVAGNQRRARAGVGQLVIRDRINLPDSAPRSCVQGMQLAVDRGHIHPAFPYCHAAVDQIAARMAPREVVRLRVVAP